MTTILTTSGTYFNLSNPHESEIRIEDIAHALSKLCRFSGHCREFYNVAQHSVLASLLVPAEHALMALLHDAAEAYIGDVTSPLKAMLPEYKIIENRVTNAIYQRFNIGPHQYPTIKHADLVMLATEREHLLPATDYQWECIRGIKPMKILNFRCWEPDEAHDKFMDRYDQIRTVGVPQV